METLGEISAWRQSMIRAYFSCPRQLLLWSKGEPQVAPYPVLRGTYIHEGAARYVDLLWREKKRHDKAAMEWISAGYQEYGDVAKVLHRFAEQSEFLWRQNTPFPGRSPVEQRYTAELPNGEVWSGTIDLAWMQPAEVVRIKDRETGEYIDITNPFLDDSPAGTEEPMQGVVIDWKTGHPAEWVAARTPFQLEGYAYLLWRNFPQAVGSYQVMIGAFRNFKQWALKPWTVELMQMPTIESRIVSTIERIKADRSFECHVGPSCRYCMFIAACPCRDSSTLRQYADTATGEGVAAAMLFHEALASAYKERLKAIVKQEGNPVVCQGHVFDFFESTSAQTREIRMVDDSYRRRNRRPPVSIDAERLARDMEADQSLREELDTVVNWRSSARFGDKSEAEWEKQYGSGEGAVA